MRIERVSEMELRDGEEEVDRPSEAVATLSLSPPALFYYKSEKTL